MDDKVEREVLLDLLRSPGWALVQKAAHAAYGPEASLARIDKTVDVLDPGALDSEREAIRSIRAESRAVMTLLEWPVQRVDDLQPKDGSRWLGRRRTGV